MAEELLFEDNRTSGRPPQGAVFLRIAVERGIDPSSGGLSYWCEPGDVAVVGERVEVPLGRSLKASAGIVVAVDGATPPLGVDPAVVRGITRRTGAALPAHLVELGRWIARYYVCPLGMVLTAMMPAAVKKGTGERNVPWVSLTRVAESLIAVGGVPEMALKPAAKKLWAAIAGAGGRGFPTPVRAVIDSGLAKSAAPIDALVAAGLLSRETRRELTLGDVVAPHPAVTADGNKRFTATPEQVAVIEGIGAALDGFSVSLIRGVTGSGKTEVYIQLIERVLELGRSAIVLVPEIILTPQTFERFQTRLGADRVIVMHSGLTASQRNHAWRRAADSEGMVVLGPRSAVFAPVRSLGLVIVDEEHDSSYKQDQLPRFSARDVAIKRAQLEGVPIVLGSATPSIESWNHAVSTPPRYRLWELPSRVGGATMPEVQVVDLREEAALRRSMGSDDGRLHLLGPTLERAIEETLEHGGQAVLLLNRRGFAQHIACPNARCGFVLGCDQCDVNLVMHRGRRLPAGSLVRCHHCLSEQLVPQLCPACGHKLNTFGGGTQRAEDELVRKFAALGLVEGSTLLRVDADEMRSTEDYFRTLESFAAGHARVLIGTQMLSKGLDFPGVTLVGVIDADTALNIPDFRASERTFQLVSQVAGRAGRGEKPGRVIVQTQRPLDPSIVFASRHDYRGFAEHELKCRMAAKLPPVMRMARLVIRDASEAAAQRRAEDIAGILRSLAEDDVMITGPAPCPISRISGQFRFEVVVIAPLASTIQRLLAELRRMYGVKSDSAIAIDVDPVAMM